MSSKIILKRSSVPNKKPTVEQLNLGEIAINTYDGKMFFKIHQEYLDETTNQNVTLEEVIEVAASVPIENTLYVQKSGNDRNNGSTWSSAFLTIEAALEAAAERNQLTLIDIGPGVYLTEGHLDVPDNTVIRAAHRSVFIRPKPGFEERNVFRLGSGCFLEGPVFEGWRLDDMDDPSEGFAIAFRPGARITRVPYVHKIVVRTPPYWTTIAPPLDRNNANPLVGRGAGVVLADAAVLDPDSIFPNIMTWGATPVTHNGIGYCAKNGGLINAVNAVSMWCHRHFYALGGGQIILSSCSTQFGDYTLVAKGTRNLIVPDEVDDNGVELSVQTTAATAITTAQQTIIDNMWANLVSNNYTTGWPADYEETTKRDAGLFLQALSWTLQTANEKPMLDLAKGFFSTIGERTYTPAPFNYEKSQRDAQLILDAVMYDVLFNSNYRSIRAALSFYRNNAANLIANLKQITVDSILDQKTLVASYLTGTSLTRANALYDEIVDIINNGTSAANAYVLTDPTSYDTGYFNARRLLMSNKTFIQDEVIAWIADQVSGNIAPFTSSFTYNSTACRNDVGHIIDALRYDLTYGGNLETYNAALAYFVGSQSQYGAGEKDETVAALQRLRTVIGSVLQGVAITKSSGNTGTQDVSGTPGSLAAANFAQARVSEIITTVSTNGLLPKKILPITTWPEQQFVDSFNTLNQNKRKIVVSNMELLLEDNKTLLGSFLHSWKYMKDQITALPNVNTAADTIVNALVNTLISTTLDPVKVAEPSTITAIGHTWTGILAGVALTKIPPARNFATIPESILELDQGLVIASGQDDQGSALFIGGMEINADTGELTGPPFDQAVNRVATRAAISRSF